MRGKVGTWVNSQWKYQATPGQFSVAINNQTKEPRETVALSSGRNAETGNAAKFDGRNGLGKEGAKPQSQRFLVHAIAGGKQPSRQDAADAARWRKVSAEIEKLPKHEREAAWLAVGDGK